MQRVSALLPLWERAKLADGTNSNSDGTTDNSRSSTRFSISRNSTGTSSSASNSTGAAVANSADNNARPTTKVFSWASRFSAVKNLSVSPAKANASTAPASTSAPPRLGREAYWPSTLDRECEKAARILKSFCTDGFFDESADPAPASPTRRTSIASFSPRSALNRRSNDVATSPTVSLSSARKKIPPRVVQEAVGLAIFSCMRSGLWMSGSGGSGILIARKADGTWSPPSGIMLHTATLAFVVGVDIYDCVLVINSVAALEMFTRPRLTLGTDVPLTVGPLVSLGLLENDFRWNSEWNNTVLTYLKARGRHHPAQLHGSLVTERSNENESFYSEDSSSGGTQPIDILDILAGNIRKSVPEILPLFEAIKAAEGRIDFDSATMDHLSQQPAPGDADIADSPDLASPVSPTSAHFGVPDAHDPDPFGIIALEMAGLEIREAGSKHRPASSQFDFHPPTSPTSMNYTNQLNRQSTEAAADHGSRASYMSTRTQATSMTDACTQTGVAETPDTSLSPSNSDDGKDASLPAADTTNSPLITSASNGTLVADKAVGTETMPVSVPTVDHSAATGEQSDADDTTAASSYFSADERDEDADDEDDESDDLGDDGEETLETGANDEEDDIEDVDEDDEDEEEPVIFEVATTATQPVRAIPAKITQAVPAKAQIILAKGSLVTIPKRVPPPLPMRSPARRSRASKSDYGDVSGLTSPYRNSVQSTLSAPACETQDETVSPASTACAASPARTSIEIVVAAPLVAELPKEEFHEKEHFAVSEDASTEERKTEVDSLNGSTMTVV